MVKWRRGQAFAAGFIFRKEDEKAVDLPFAPWLACKASKQPATYLAGGFADSFVRKAQLEMPWTIAKSPAPTHFRRAESAELR